MIQPTHVQLKRQSNVLCLTFEDTRYELSAEYLRVYSPSAEVVGHGGPYQWPVGKLNIKLTCIEPVGHYALQLKFDDGHDSGLFTWEHLWTLCQRQKDYWSQYLIALNNLGVSRDPQESTIKII